ncbi:MAG: transporter substrate-binding domain-containing protein [Lachnospiraceae bacterium]|nr:transporter substrate-binding domain-containing protein [Lachnospiraceae bacterium]
MKKNLVKAIVLTLAVGALTACATAQAEPAPEAPQVQEAPVEEAANEDVSEAQTEEQNDAEPAAETITVQVGTMGTYSPFSFQDEAGNLTGYDIEVVRKIEEIDPSLHFEFTSGPWDSLFVGLDSDKFQMLANQIAKTEQRKEKYYLTDNSYFVATNQLIVKGDNDTITSFQDLVDQGATLGLTVGDNHNEEAELWNEEHPDAQINITYYEEDVTTILQDIENGRIAATLNDPAVAVSKAEIQGLDVKPVGAPVDQTPVFFIFQQNETGKEIQTRVDAALTKLKESGELAALSEQWFEADYTEIREEQ